MKLPRHVLANGNMFLMMARYHSENHRLSELVEGEFRTVLTIAGKDTNLVDLANHIADVIKKRHTKPRALVVDSYGLGGGVLDLLTRFREDSDPADWGRCEVIGG